MRLSRDRMARAKVCAEPARGSSEEWQADWHDARPFCPRLTARPIVRVLVPSALVPWIKRQQWPSHSWGGRAGCMSEASCAFALMPRCKGFLCFRTYPLMQGFLCFRTYPLMQGFLCFCTFPLMQISSGSPPFQLGDPCRCMERKGFCSNILSHTTHTTHL